MNFIEVLENLGREMATSANRVAARRFQYLLRRNTASSSFGVAEYLNTAFVHCIADAGEDSPMTRILPHMQPISNQEAGSSLQERPTDDGSSLGS